QAVDRLEDEVVRQSAPRQLDHVGVIAGPAAGEDGVPGFHLQLRRLAGRARLPAHQLTAGAERGAYGPDAERLRVGADTLHQRAVIAHEQTAIDEDFARGIFQA